PPETAARVAAGAVARKALATLYPQAEIRAFLTQIGAVKIDPANFSWSEISRNPFWCPDASTAQKWEDLLEKTRKAGSSLGAIVEVVASGFPAGLGAPIYGKLDADLAAALMSINAVKGVEIGAGMAAAELSGEENADEIRIQHGRPHFLSNNAGGILGGISTGQDIVARFAVKPTSSILAPRRTITRNLEETEIVTRGRHDPCVGIRAVPVAVAVTACVLIDHALLHRAQCGGLGGTLPSRDETT
ncbi:MAG: chorismate synthase, partial [Parvularculaceae bacterium]|nr:chorismate synthase [Parvularculaceae bacterium]